MMTRTGFRGLNAAQRDIIAHWQMVKGERDMPRKSDIDPGALRVHLASISMIEVDYSGEARFRLVGTRLRQILGGEMRGRSLQELDREKAEMWTLGLIAAIERGQPTGGIINRKIDRHAWLRLPLDPGPGVARLVLCHDVLLSHDARDTGYPSAPLSPIRGPLAA